MAVKKSTFFKLLLGALLAAAAGIYATSAVAKPAITWMPAYVSEAIEQGVSKQVVVSVISSETISGATLFLTPELAPFVTVPTASFNLQASVPHQIALTLTAAGDERPDIRLDGTLHVRFGNKTAANPLPITLDIKKASIASDNLRVEYVVPIGWRRSPFNLTFGEFGDALSSPEAQRKIDAGSLATAPDIALSIIPNPGNLSLVEFVETYDNGWYSTYASSTYVTIDGFPAIILDDRSDALASSPSTVAITVAGGGVVLIGFGWLVADQLAEFLSNVQINAGGGY